jgi:toxin secretion/phage lysis holin
MEKLFNWISIIGGTIGGILISFLGGMDKLLVALLIFVILDYVTGLLKAIYNKKLSSEIGFKGIVKKVMIIIVVGVSVTLENNFGIPAIREIVIMFFAINEAISLLENASQMGLPIPEKLKNVLLQLRDKNFEK